MKRKVLGPQKKL